MPSKFVLQTFLIVLLVTTLFVAKIFSVFFTAIVFALILVTLFKPLHERIAQRLPNKRAASAFLTTTVVFFGAVIPVFILFASLSRQVYELYATTKDSTSLSAITSLFSGNNGLFLRVSEIAATFGFDLTPEKLQELISNLGKSIASTLYTNVAGFAQNILGFLFHFGIMMIIIFGLFLEGSRVKTFLMELSPLPDAEEEVLLSRFREISQAVFLGNGLSSVLQGFFGGLAFSLSGLGPGLLWGSFITIFAFLPIVGAAVVFLPATAFLVLKGDYSTAVFYFLFNASYVGVLEYWLKPKLIGGRAELPGILVFLGIVGGLNVFGILGLFYGPLALTMFLTLVKMYHDHYKPSLFSPHELESKRQSDPPPEPGSESNVAS